MDQIIICNVRIITRLAVPLSSTERFKAHRYYVLVQSHSVVYRRRRQLFSSTKW